MAEKVFRKILAGTLKAVSVGFMPLERGEFGKGDEAVGEKNETYYYGRCELLEISVTPLPANKNALVRSIGADPIGETMERMSIDGEFDRIEDDAPPADTTSENRCDDFEEDRALAMALDLNARYVLLNN